jgi:glycosyltransferase involved in cell wall biosynthesis
LFDKTLEPIKDLPNISMQKGAVQQVSIPNVHQQYGLFLCPTRQDAQGVSMCEAMSSGLVPITTNNTAIPEFVSHQKSGFLTNNPEEIADAIEKLYYEPKLFTEVSANAAASIRQLCNIENITKKELTLIEN